MRLREWHLLPGRRDKLLGRSVRVGPREAPWVGVVRSVAESGDLLAVGALHDPETDRLIDTVPLLGLWLLPDAVEWERVCDSDPERQVLEFLDGLDKGATKTIGDEQFANGKEDLTRLRAAIRAAIRALGGVA